MNNSYYTLPNGEHLVSTDTKMKKVKYNNNIQEVLIFENALEQTEKMIEEKRLSIRRKKSKIKDEAGTMFGLSALFLVMPFFLTAFLYFISGSSNSLVDTPLGQLPYCANVGIQFGIFCIPFSMYSFIKGSLLKRKLNREIKGEEVALDYLNQEKERLKEDIDRLINEKNNTLETKAIESDKIIEIKDRDIISYLLNVTKLYYECGYNQNKYLKYYLRGVLRKVLKSEYTDEQIELIAKKMKESLEKQLKELEEINNKSNTKVLEK